MRIVFVPFSNTLNIRTLQNIYSLNYAMPNDAHQHPWVILFDIDGTLLTVDRSFNRPLLRSILDELEIDYPEMEQDPFSGRTDHDIIGSFLVRHDNQEELYARFKSRYLEKLAQDIAPSHVLRHEHIDEAIEYFTGPNFITGLLTGNYPHAAQVKLKAAAIHYNFSFGAFGEYHTDRNMLPQLALEHIKEQLAQDPDPQRFLIIGDTPRDILCAKSAQMKCVAVTTGKFSREELAEFEPDVILDSLANPDRWFNELVNH